VGRSNSWPSSSNGAMPQNRIKELRLQKRLTQDELGALIGVTQEHVGRLERSIRLLQVPVAERIAKALDTTVAEVLGIEANDPPPPPGLSDDAVPYVAGNGDPFAMLQSDNRFLWTSTSDCLDNLRIHRGDVVVVNNSASAVKAVEALKPVLVRWCPNGDIDKPLTLLRQFVPPRLLITNSSSSNAPMLVIGEDEVQIVGVVEGAHRRLG
jgi:transcriptional regulator with XRE-family HTH domain